MPSHTGNKHHNLIKILSHTFNKKYHLNKIRKKTVCSIFLPIIIGIVCNLPFDYAHSELDETVIINRSVFDPSNGEDKKSSIVIDVVKQYDDTNIFNSNIVINADGSFKESLKVEGFETFETEIKAITDSVTYSIEAFDIPAITDSALVLGMFVLSETENPPL